MEQTRSRSDDRSGLLDLVVDGRANHRSERERPRRPDRGLEVLRRVAGSLGNDEISRALHISTSTVREPVQNALGKLKVGSRLAAVLGAIELRLL